MVFREGIYFLFYKGLLLNGISQLRKTVNRITENRDF